jgi:hypothetical protein
MTIDDLHLKKDTVGNIKIHVDKLANIANTGIKNITVKIMKLILEGNLSNIYGIINKESRCCKIKFKEYS